MATTIITGCRLVLMDEERAVWGDLWSQGSTYIFNAILHHGETGWDFDFQPNPREKQVQVLGHHYFERRGVIVFEHAIARLNDIAYDYVYNSPAIRNLPKGQ